MLLRLGEPQGPCGFSRKKSSRLTSNRFSSPPATVIKLAGCFSLEKMCPWSQEALPICLSDGFGEGKQGGMCARVPCPVPRRVSPTCDDPASSTDHRKGGAGVSAAGGLAGGCIHTAAHRGPAAQAAGGTLEGLHAAVPLDVQMLQPPALPALPKLHLDLTVDKAV